jgi:hypothetical protein
MYVERNHQERESECTITRPQTYKLQLNNALNQADGRVMIDVMSF